VLALGLAAGLLYIPYAEVMYTERITARLDLFCIVGAGIILWNIFPRPDRFTAPGPRLTAAAHPQLFRVLEEVAAATGQAMPAEVYALPEMNAWVAQRGGVLGIGSRRVMGLGLPLMQVLSVDEFRAVVAHEFGHYHGGDTALGPWIYRTRAAIERTLIGMSNHSAVTMKPFEWYLKMYVRVTHAISRRQEFVADALAARVAGVQNVASGLRAVHAVGAAFDPFWFSEVVPALERGYRPPLADGFRRFLAAPGVASAVDEGLERELREGKVDPYDTHPPLRERIAALRGFTPTAPSGSSVPALTLLSDVAAVEDALLRSVLANVPGGPKALRPIAWERMLEEVWLPGWMGALEQDAKRLRGLTPARLPEFAGDPARLAGYMTLATNEEQQGRAVSVAGCALAVALHRRGLTPEAEPGQPITYRADSISIRPFAVLAELADGTLTREEWQRTIDTLGIASLDLSTVGEPVSIPA
jgi:Zn-dependent protease with chaperone function